MCWQNDVKWSIAQYNDPKRFMTVHSGGYILAIPDLSHYARVVHESISADSDSVSTMSIHKGAPIFKKTIMKLSGKVQWLAGLVFERALDSGGRSFDFIPHYDVILRHPKYAKDQDGLVSEINIVHRLLTNIPPSHMMRSGDSGVITFIYQSQ